MIHYPNAKINLGLYITSKRPDGYHQISSCLYPIPLCDALEIIPSKKITFASTGIPIPGKEEDNLILKAYKLLRKDFPDLPPISVHLHKVIPIGAGLGGGSADAGFSLTLMNRLFDLFLDDWLLEEYAAKLGSDCPFFVQNTPKLVSGRGEFMEDISVDLTGKWIVIINPNIHISSQEAYAGVTPKPPLHDLKQVLSDRIRWKDELINDFEPSIFEKYPLLTQVKQSLYAKGAFYAAMSGSGSSLFGLFDQEPHFGKSEEGFFVYEGLL
ncbi:MAG TPA: 4-(cytidine 5'-diphospho)-2-C-methyl-D-erythritol kinase [Lunatimonas sp.]|nr:4-(cytidine 5'-diphospho)-2-C-methyl-D-erythritol kinase [Lunatimonas sp.]